MRRMLQLLICLISISIITGCMHPTKNGTGSKEAVKEKMASCQMMCKKRFGACHEACQDSCTKCSHRKTQAAVRSFHKYKHQQCVQGDAIARELHSYCDPLKCAKTTCDCHADYRVCMQNCSGFIHKRLQVAPACC